ncbi:hypothetical protein ACWC0C_06995 [Streptomyces sp. NPDC001709]
MAWGAKSQSGQQKLNDRLAESRRKPVEGKPVPAPAQRNGRMDG